MTSNKVLSENIFHDGEGRLLNLFGVLEATKAYIAKYPDARYEIVVGSDSQAALSGEAYFVSTVVIRRIGNGGIHFWMRHQEKFYNLQDRIWKEAMLSITLAQELKSIFKEQIGEELFWAGKLDIQCIHIDVGQEGPTKDFIDSVCGMVKGFGFEPVIKPYAYGAFVVADRHT